MKMNNIIIDDELKKYMRPLRDEEYEKLKESVLSEGIRDPLVTWNGRLLDGYHRYKIAQEYNLEYKTIDIDIPDKEAAKEWMIINQLGRRNLTPQETSYYRGKLYESKKRQGARTDLTSGQNVQKLSTAEEIGKQYGVDEKTIRRDAEFSKVVDKITEEVGEEAKRAILSGQANIPKKDIEKLIEIKQKAPELVKPVLQGEVPLQRAKLEVQKKIAASIPKPAPPEGKYAVIYADPPWPVGSMVMDKWESPIEEKYPTMSIEEIKQLPIKELAAEQCSLFLWTTHTFLPDALKLIEEWGFKYFCCITWDKGNGWTQNGFHKRTEFLLYAYKGGINVNQYGDAIPTLIFEQKTYHSKKPDIIRDMIKNKTPEPRIELFARGYYDGWEVWGNEV